MKEVFKEEENEDESEHELKETQEEVMKVADEGELLVMRRVLSNQKGVKDEQTENIFHTQCTVQGKACSLIIDGGSCANIVSLSMIEKLGLQTMTHPHPYNIQWMNQSKGIQVNSRCLISFSIRKNYQYELWCDVIPMDACHMLLGRPWLYDYKVMHNGYLNTYSFTKDGKKITLAPLPPSKLHEIQPQNKHKQADLLLSVSEPLLKASQHEFKAFKEWILSIQDELASSLPTHPVPKTLIQNFCHLFPEETPTGFPPTRDIQHHIDLIPGSILPNKPDYRMNPKDIIEIQCQVEELYTKGLIHESLSPYAIPAPLVRRRMVECICVWTIGPLIRL